MRVGIEKIGVYPTSMALRMDRLCEARGHDLADIRDVMMIDERSVNPPWEDPVTMAVNAAMPILTEQDRANIELLLVCSESGVDQEKPMSTWVQRYLGLSSRTRNLEVKHACYSGTGAVQLAAAWAASGVASKKAKALVITTDQSRMHLGKPYEFVMGAGATAIVVSQSPQLFELELGKSGVHTHEVSDLTRPTSRVETGNSETSLLSYLEALDGALLAYLERVGEKISYDYFARNLYHVPFGGMTQRASRAALRHFGDWSRPDAERVWRKKTEPSLAHLRRMGGTYASSTFIALTTLLERDAELKRGDRIGVYSYGSGSCAEFYSGLVGEAAAQVAAGARLREQLDARYSLSVREYEDAERERTCYVDCGDYQPSTDGFGDLYRRVYEGSGRLVFEGAAEHYRQYGWS